MKFTLFELLILLGFIFAYTGSIYGEAVPDEFENDNSRDSAVPINTGAVQNRNFDKAGDEDWVTFYASEGIEYFIGTENVSLRNDVVLTLYDSDGFVVVHQDDLLAKTVESFLWTPQVSGDYFLRVRQFDAAVFGDDTEYDLIVYWQSAFDGYEIDNSFSTAKPISTDGVVQHHGLHRNDDNDWTFFNANSGDELYIRVENYGGVDLGFTIYDSDGVTPLASEDQGYRDHSEQLTWIAPYDGKFFLLIYADEFDYINHNPKYTVFIWKRDPASGTDAYETDDVIGNSTPLLLGKIPQPHNIHTGQDVDWFSLTFDSVTAVVITTDITSEEQKLSLSFFDKDGKTLLMQFPSDIYWGVDFIPPEAGTYYLQVSPILSSLKDQLLEYDIGMFQVLFAPPLPDLVISHSLGSDVTVNDEFLLNVTVTAYSDVDEVHKNVQVKTILQGDMKLTGQLPNECTMVGPSLTCNLGDLDDGTTLLSFPLTVNSARDANFSSTVFAYQELEQINRVGDEFPDNNLVTTRISPKPSMDNEGVYFIETTTAAPLTGLWWNESESGWGVTLTQQFDIIFATIFTYDRNGNPMWYVASNCKIVYERCSGTLYEVRRGSNLGSDWSDLDKTIRAVGNLDLVFHDNDNSIMSLDIDGKESQIKVTRQIFSSLTPEAEMNALWWNPDESGWGVTLIQQSNIVFATIFTYRGWQPYWLVASNCVVVNNSCTGALYELSGGSTVTEIWQGRDDPVEVGEVTFTFSDADNGRMDFIIDGQPGSKTISRQIWATSAN